MLQFSCFLLLGASVAAAIAAAAAATMTTALTTALATAVTATLTLASTVGCGRVSMFRVRFAAPCCSHGHFVLCLSLALPCRKTVRVGGLTFAMAQSQDARVKTQSLRNLAQAHIHAPHSSNLT
jgi:hypothetical protein